MKCRAKNLKFDINKNLSENVNLFKKWVDIS